MRRPEHVQKPVGDASPLALDRLRRQVFQRQPKAPHTLSTTAETVDPECPHEECREIQTRP
jgi:hypothetical protein